MKQPISHILFVATCVISIALSGCASSQVNEPLTLAGVALAQAVADVEIAKALRSHGMSEGAITETITTLRAITDALIAGEGLRVVFDARWTAVRLEAISRFSTALAGLRVDGIVVFDDIGARALVTPLVDAFAATVRAAIGGADAQQQRSAVQS